MVEIKNGYGINLKISFATDSRINGVQKSGFSEISKKRLGQKCFLLLSHVRFFLQFLKPKRFLSRPHFYSYSLNAGVTAALQKVNRFFS